MKLFLIALFGAIGTLARYGLQGVVQIRMGSGFPYGTLLINLTGCLQKGGGLTSSYVLTQVNEPTRSVGTSGSSQPDVVKQEQMREAKHSYRLDGNDDQLGSLVGKQVRVEGTVAEKSDLNKRAGEDRKDTDKPADIDTGDLAKVKVNSISAVSDACGQSANDQRRP